MHLKKIKVKAIALLTVLLFIAGQCLAAGASVEDILKYTNEFRKSKGKPALVLDETANDLAEKHSENMAKGRTSFGHSGFKERVQALRSDGTFISAAAENVAYGNMNAREVVDGWIKSPTHRKNMLGNFNYIGIGVAKAKNGNIYFTQLFFKR